VGWIPYLLTTAWLLPLASFLIISFFGQKPGLGGRGSAHVATGAIILSFTCALIAAGLWLYLFPISSSTEHASHLTSGALPRISSREPKQECTLAANRSATELKWCKTHEPQRDLTKFAKHDNSRHEVSFAGSHSSHEDGPSENTAHFPVPTLAGTWWVFAEFGQLKLPIGYYIDALTILMMVMVTLVATCIHIYSWGYMSEELQDTVVDHEITRTDGLPPVVRPGRFHRYFQYLSLFSFSMLGLVLASNLFMVFVFWELVGICSYLLIGFYLERPAAVRAATKAFVVNRIGDFGMLVGIAAFWAATGTVAFTDDSQRPGLFTVAAQLKQFVGEQASAGLKAQGTYLASPGSSEDTQSLTYFLLLLGGLGIFCGCVGKSAQFPLHVWLPDAMEGPTPVSALIHAATMVAAGVYLVGRFYPALTAEALFIIAAVGTVSLFLAGTMALVAKDIKRVLAFSTISQLGLMMFGLGIGGWVAGLFHLITHAFFKALLFLCAGSVIHATHTGDMTQLGGLVRKMPWTAMTMLVGCLAIIGAGIPPWGGLSGFYSKDAILAQAYLLASYGGLLARIFLGVAVLGAFLTGLYIFRLWFLTFAGPSRDPNRLDHAHESSPTMLAPIVTLAVLSVIAGWTVPATGISIPGLLLQADSRPHAFTKSSLWPDWTVPPEADSHAPEIHGPASWLAFSAGMLGVLTATIFYGLRWLDAKLIARLFPIPYRLLWNRWFIDWLYEKVIVTITLRLAQVVAWVDKQIIDTILDGAAGAIRTFAFTEDLFDRRVVDGAVNSIGHFAYRLGSELRRVQTGLLRQYLAIVVASIIILFCLSQFL